MKIFPSRFWVSRRAKLIRQSLQNIKEGIEGHAVGWYHEVFDLVFKNLDRAQANKSRVVERKKKKDESDDEDD